MAIVDTHAHYLAEDFGEELIPLIEAMPANGIDKIVAVGYNIQSSEEEIRLSERFPYVFAAAGVHPENCNDLPLDWLEQIERLAQNERVVSVGEIGLDYHYGGEDRELQKRVFAEQLVLSKRIGKPVIIHSRDACEDTMAILREYRPEGVLHCFSGSAETAAEVVKLGMYVGFTGVLTFKNAKKALSACEAVPLDRLLLETDCPYMAPVPHRGKRCDSTMLRYTAEKMAEIKGVSFEEICRITSENAERLFRI